MRRRDQTLYVRLSCAENKKQPVATWERYEATVAAIQKLRSESDSDEPRMRWARMEFALFLAERTGKRLGSIRQLRWEDFGFERQVVYWRAEADKKGYKWEVPMPTYFFESVRTFQREIGAVGGFVFAAPNSCDGMIDRHWFDEWLTVAEKKAKLPKLDGSLWHAYRRKWAIERKHLPLKDVAAAGGCQPDALLQDEIAVCLVKRPQIDERRKRTDHKHEPQRNRRRWYWTEKGP